MPTAEIDLLEDVVIQKIPPILDVQDLDQRLPDICNNIFAALTSKQLEATYQRCLKVDLEEAGITVEEEVVLVLKYKGRQVGTRRADLVLQTSDAKSSVLELKCVNVLTTAHLQQLQYYMHHLGIDNGYLINFPHAVGFPEVSTVFKQEVLCAPARQFPLSDRQMRSQQIGKVCVVKVLRTGIPSSQYSQIPDSIDESRRSVWGVTQKGEPCKICIRQQAFCRQHKLSQVQAAASSLEDI
jgi:GxxExxY protein